MLITSSRLYDVTPSARAKWHALFDAAYRKAGLHVQAIEHAWPATVGELWARPGLCGTFMCGWPFAQALHDGRLFHGVASIVPAWPAYQSQARYRSEFLIRADKPWQQLEDSFGHRYGWMVLDSQSGWNAPRGVLSQYAQHHGDTLFSASKGPYGNPRNLIQALHEDDIDITAVDGWYLDLIRVHEPNLLDGIRTLGYTPWTPNPLVVCSPDVSTGIAHQLSEVLLNLHQDPVFLPLLQQTHVERFVPVDHDAYNDLRTVAEQAQKSGYPAIR